MEQKITWDKFLYTWEHKKAFLKVERQYFHKNTWRGYVHDLDKLLWWFPIAFLFGKTDKWVQKKHRLFAKHHAENKQPKSDAVCYEMIIDWECARFTKPDKPLNAVQTLEKFYPSFAETILPYMVKMTLITDAQARDCMQRILQRRIQNEIK